MTFSGALTLTDLNDYITPSQACIKPLEQSNAPNPRTPGDAATEIRIDASGAYYELGQGSGGSSGGTQKLQTAEISLTDCLACSGCITSAESVLITLQSHTEVLSVLAANPSPGSPGHRIPVLSIAPQSIASLAAALAPSSSHSGTTTPTIPLVHMLNRVQAFATRTLGFAHVFDTTFAREIVLREHVREFSERKERAAAASGSGSTGALPMLSSACPGWVCYAEKTHGEMLPFIAATKSPQQVMGTLVKEWLAPHYWDKRPDEVYHVTVMPCYDKKLEASRSDFYNEQYATRDVDCVITTGELLLLAQEHGIDLSLLHPGSSSGSYLHSLMLAVARTYPNPLTQESKTVRSADYVEHTLRDASSGSPVFRGATCYGFRNLQNVVRRVGRATGVQVGRGAAGRLAGGLRNNRSGDGTAYDYVEVMACPGGCVGGGGQLRAPEKKAASSSSSNNGANHDAEGFVRDWAADGVEGSNNKSRHTGTAELEAPWSSRAWTREVERVYWGAGNDRLAALAAGPEKPIPKHALAQVRVPQAQEQALLALALPTPPASPKPPRGSGGVDGGEGCASAEGSRAYGQGHGDHGAKESRGGGATVVSHQRPSSFGMDAARVHVEQRELESECVDMDVDVVVDLLVERVLRELCAAPGRRQQQEDEIVMAEMRRRRELFRTEYRVVESEIIGLGVKW
ncbi:iron hydrogenase [Russula aff. rugulosa BPL654]|nr:iron hydrogenase [Russula aff. rugulosa BPL654]